MTTKNGACPPQQLRAIVSGRVQMVMYRDFATRKARRLRLTGTVRNLPDDTVEVIAEGLRKDLEAFIIKLKRGPFLADVENVEVAWAPATNAFTDFSIAYK